MALTRLLDGGRAEPHPLRPEDLLLVVLAGGVGAGLAMAWASGFYGASGWQADDFDQYCLTLSALRDAPLAPDPDLMRRAPVAGYPAALLASALGIVDGSTAAAVVAVVGLGILASFHARLLGGRTAAVVAPLWLGAIAPLALAGRELTFTPWTALTFVAGAVTATAALLRPEPGRLLLLGLLAGAAAAVDQLGIGFGLAWLGLGGLAALSGERLRLAGLAALAVGLAASFALAASVPPAKDGPGDAPLVSLEFRLSGQTALVADDQFDTRVDASAAQDSPYAGFYWGHSDLRRLPETARRVRALLRPPTDPDAPPAERDPGYDAGLKHIVQPHLLWLVLPAGLALLGLRPRRLRPVVALLLPLVPFVGWLAIVGPTTLQSQAGHSLADGTYAYTVRPRFLLVGLGVAPALLGLAVAGLGLPARPGRRGRAPLAAAVLVGLSLLTITGVVPSLASPVAPWRLRLGTPDWPVRVASLLAAGEVDEARARALGTAIETGCQDALAEDAAHGHLGGWSGVTTAVRVDPIRVEDLEQAGPPGSAPHGP